MCNGLCIQAPCTQSIIRGQNANGYIEMGPINTAFAHIQTDRSRFYFNKCIIVDEGVVESYNDDLVLKSSYTGSACDIILKTGSTNRLIVAASDGKATFCNDIFVTGTLCKNSGSFHIPHPLPALSASKRLVHSFVEAPGADNIYTGTITLTSGSATVDIDKVSGMTDGTYVALNRCSRVFTTNETNWDPVRGSISANTLTIESCVSNSSAIVSWMVVGERQDPHMMHADTRFTDNNGRVIVEPDVE
tara:strand:- start:127 stop:867 length:741 start_codon:yes stop_codon:yes gene_type:complete